jgi:predicted amidohydrolase
LTFGILICNDSNFFEPARIMASKGATALFVLTNNGMPASRSRPELVAHTRYVDVVRAMENGLFLIRADVAGKSDGLVSYGTSAIVDPDGQIIQSAAMFSESLLIADVETTARQGRGRKASKNRAVAEEYRRLLGHDWT